MASEPPIHIRVLEERLQPIQVNTPSANTPVSRPAQTHLYLIEGALGEIQHFAGTTADWIIRVAHYICSPLAAGRIYTHTTHTAEYWYGREKDDTWREVSPADQLLPGIYEFDTGGDSLITLSRLSQSKSQSSRTSSASKSSSANFRKQLERRDRGCVVTHWMGQGSFVASHLVPKRLGTEGAKSVVRAFVGDTAANTIDTFHPMLGVSLALHLAKGVDMFRLGFYHISDNTYVLHNFDPESPDLNYFGIPTTFLPGPPLHGYQVTLQSSDPSVALPPPGSFSWHYLQCVAKRFATKDYKSYPNVYLHVFPFRTDDDDDTDGMSGPEDGNDSEPPYPTYHFDQYLARQARLLDMNERAEGIASWSANVASTGDGVQGSRQPDCGVLESKDSD